MIKIYISYHQNTRIIQSEILTPIHAGRTISKIELPIQGDNTGDNISEKNPFYCEMTTIYWAWKNDLQSDYIGFFHYRRFFDFYPRRKRNHVLPFLNQVDECGMFDDFFEEYGLNDEKLNQFIPQYDAIIPEPYSCGTILRKEYSQKHNMQDFDLLGNYFKTYYPSDIPFFEKMTQSHYLYQYNMFIFKRNIFEQYCEWIFPILYHLEQQLDMQDYNRYDRRAIGFLSERLTSMFIIKNLLHQTSLKIKQLRPIFVHKTPPILDTPQLPHTHLPIVTVVTSSDKNYFAHTAAMLASVLKNTNHQVFIDIIILVVDLEEEDRHYLLFLERLHPFCKINFLDIFYQCRKVKKHPDFPNTSYFRIVMADLLKNHNKVIYIDPDTIVISDISELFNTDVSHHYAAVCLDMIVQAFCHKKIPSSPLTNSLPAKIYCSEYLKIDFQQYFQAGVMLMNLKKFRETELTKAMLVDAENHHFWFADQCILNKHLFGQVKFIDGSWNVTNLEKDFELYLTDNLCHLFQKIVKNPKIINFAGWKKPWIFDPPFGNYYWFYLKYTPYYEKVFNQRFKRIDIHADVHQYYHMKDFIRNKLFSYWSRLPKSVQKLILPLAKFINQQLQ